MKLGCIVPSITRPLPAMVLVGLSFISGLQLFLWATWLAQDYTKGLR